MAEIVNSEEISEIEAVEQNQPEPEKQVDEIPEKYRNKSPEDLIRMHQETEKLMGRQAQEVGEIRKLADELIRAQIKPDKKEEPDELDFFENPQEAIRRAVESNPRVVAAEQVLIRMAQDQAKQRFEAKHPDVGDIIKDPEFINWVKASPARIKKIQAADAYDMEAADDLVTTFKEVRTVRAKNEDGAEKQARANSIKSVAVQSGGSGESGKKVWRRAEIIDMKIHDPRKFAIMEHEINAAYSEGRVK